jgi:hypothetical protein
MGMRSKKKNKIKESKYRPSEVLIHTRIMDGI